MDTTTIEVPHFFVCPISLQIMKDPVTAATGITYDRENIERWLFSDRNTTCPVTNQPLPRDSELTPNHTLRRLIQAWCTTNAVDRIPTPRAPLDRVSASSLLADLPTSLELIDTLASANESNRRCIVQAGAASSIVRLVVSCSGRKQYDRVEQALGLLRSLRIPSDELKPLVADNHELVESLTQALRHESDSVRSAAILAVRSVAELAGANLAERLSVGFFEAVTGVVRDGISPQATQAALHVLLSASPWGRNRTKIVEAGAVAELIELELGGPDRRRTELVLGVLEHLCGCADGRAQLAGHAAGIAVVSKRILRVSAASDDCAVGILSSLCKYSATNEVLQEMLRVGAVSKLCLVIQADCSSAVREKARWLLRLHSGVWKNSSCINIFLFTS
ncbi:putative E3 ubiquitin-protein ligase PUB23 [Iris pallida]|uniref:U-box domain-containing protein n=1 Tax=Iris pallida TaxID=29817 RepID=A0AAX6E2Q1_IRIPA|nr:putative E3 ubiquitin-protein ligase PUB23 [Iris pallida]